MKQIIIITTIITLAYFFPAKAQIHLDLVSSGQVDNFYELQKIMEDRFNEIGKGKGTGYKQWKRWEWYMETRINKDGSFDNIKAKTWDAHFQYLKNPPAAASKSAATTNGFWESLGPNSYTKGIMGNNGGIGRINCIEFHPTNSNIMWVGTPAGGLWKTTNGGTTWTSLTDGMPSIGVSGIAVDPNNTNIIYILTGDGDGGDSFTIGVLKSTNGGTTWRSTGRTYTTNQTVRGFKLAKHPTNSNILFAAMTDGLWKTSDGGSNWTNVRSGSFRDVEFKPGDPTIMYAATTNGYVRSSNTGDTWSTITSGLSSISSANRCALAIAPSNTSRVYLIAGSGNGLIGVFRSTDSGLTFSQRTNSSDPNILGRATDGNDNVSQSNYDLAIAVSPSNSNHVVVGGINTWRSTDGGASWEIRSYWEETNIFFEYVHADIHSLDFHPLTSSLFCGTDGGIFRGNQAANGWVDLSSSLVTTQFYRIGGLNSDPNVIFGGTQDNGSNKWTSSSYTHVLGGDGGEAIIDYNFPNVVFVSSQNGNIMKSIDGGALFFPAAPPNQAGNGAFITPYIMDPVNPGTMFAAYTDIFRTTNGGFSWTDLNCGNTSGTHRALIQGINNRNRLYASEISSGNSVLRMSNNALSSSPSFSVITNPTTAGTVTGFAIDPTTSNRVFASISGFSSGNKVFRSTNSGTTWTNISGSLPNVPVNCILYEAGSNDGLYVGTDIGVFYRDNDIGDWIPFRNGLPTVPVTELEINTSSNKLRAATFGRGLWETSLFSNCPASYGLNQANDPGNPNYTGFQFYEASNNISSSRVITGGLGTDVTYKAGSRIILTTGFRARRDNKFIANLGACVANSLTQKEFSGIYEGPMEGIETTTEINIDPWNLEASHFAAFPNPFSNQTRIEYAIQSDGPLELSIYDINGKLIESILQDNDATAGTYKVQWEPMNLAAGTYFCRKTDALGVRMLKLIINK